MSPSIDHDLSMAGLYRRDPEHARASLRDALENWNIDELGGILKQMVLAFPAQAPAEGSPSHDDEGFELPSPNSMSALLERVGLRLDLAPIESAAPAEEKLAEPISAQAA